MRDLRRAPLLHFFVLGGLCLAAQRWLGGTNRTTVPVDRTILVDAPSSARARSSASLPGAPLSAPSQARLDELIDEEVLYREGLALADEGRDPVVRRRMVSLLRALELGETGEGDLEAQARELGLARHDAVVRRYLIEAMRLALAQPAPDDRPDEAAIADYYARHAARLREPATVRLAHVYLSRDRHGAALEADAARLLDRLNEGKVAPDVSAALGDPFARGASFRATDAQLDGIFGVGFAARIARLPIGAWAGPIPSAYGAHLVWIEGRAEGSTPSLAAVRGRIVQGLLRERGERRAQARMDALRTRYAVKIAGKS